MAVRRLGTTGIALVIENLPIRGALYIERAQRRRGTNIGGNDRNGGRRSSWLRLSVRYGGVTGFLSGDKVITRPVGELKTTSSKRVSERTAAERQEQQ